MFRIPWQQRVFYRLRRGLRLKDGPGKRKSGHYQSWAEVGIHPLAIGQDRPKPATRRVADGERMNPRRGVRVRANAGDDEHQGDEDLESSPAPGAAAPDLRIYI